MRVLMLCVLMNLVRVAEFVWLLVVLPATLVEGWLKAVADWAETEWLLAVAQGKTKRGG